MIRPELKAFAARWHEVGLAFALVALGLWLMRLGGYLLLPVGAGLALLGLGWALTAWRRLRFTQGIAAPGLVEVDEGQIGYLGPTFGGYVGLAELVEIRLLTLHGERLWRLRQSDGQAVLIPVAAAGGEKLFDVFGALPGIDMAALVAALDRPHAAGDTTLPAVAGAELGSILWRRAERHVLT